jgi:hypothetical protein
VHQIYDTKYIPLGRSQSKKAYDTKSMN